MIKRIVLSNIKQLVTPKGHGPRRGSQMGNLLFIENACLVMDDGLISYVGSMEACHKYFQGFKQDNSGHMEKWQGYKQAINDEIEVTIIDCSNQTVLPGFVDSHTHFVFGGSREEEFKMRLAGADYMEILKAGGGIHASVASTRAASEDELYQDGLKKLKGILAMGVTTLEGKSGYGLDLETEIKQLQVMKKLNRHQPIDIVSTFLGPHSVPKEYKGRQEDYMDFVIKEVLPEVVAGDLAEFADVFCEKGVFSIKESKYYLSAAKDMGLKLKVHADEIVRLGGAELAVELGAKSADHLLAASEEGVKALAEGDTIGTLLPATAFSLREAYARARHMIDSGCALALASDFNPGSCPTYSIPLIISLASQEMHMTIEEIITALTINGACALDKQDSIGSLEVGKLGDALVIDAPSIDFLPYHLGVNQVSKVIKKGNIVWEA